MIAKFLLAAAALMFIVHVVRTIRYDRAEHAKFKERLRASGYWHPLNEDRKNR